MSLVKTLAKVAVGVAVAKGINSMRGGAPQGAGTLPGGRSLGSLLGGGGLGSLAASLGGGGTAGAGMGAPAAGAMGGGAGTGTRIGGAQSVGSDTAGVSSLGGLGGALGGMLGGGGSASGGLGGLLAGLGGGAAAGGLGGLLNQALSGTTPEREPTREEEDAAAAMMTAMVHAMKADGRLDERERRKLLDHLDDLASDERAAVEAELQGPADAQTVARKTPSGAEAQVYAAALMAIDVDEESERRWLAELADALGLSRERQDEVRGAMDGMA